jgi:hypothetical protein
MSIHSNTEHSSKEVQNFCACWHYATYTLIASYYFRKAYKRGDTRPQDGTLKLTQSERIALVLARHYDGIAHKFLRYGQFDTKHYDAINLYTLLYTQWRDSEFDESVFKFLTQLYR